MFLFLVYSFHTIHNLRMHSKAYSVTMCIHLGIWTQLCWRCQLEVCCITGFVKTRFCLREPLCSDPHFGVYVDDTATIRACKNKLDSWPHVSLLIFGTVRDREAPILRYHVWSLFYIVSILPSASLIFSHLFYESMRVDPCWQCTEEEECGGWTSETVWACVCIIV